MPSLTAPLSTGLTITNPLVLYRALLATRQIDPDPAQHRLAIHLQKLYHRLKDYSPQDEYGTRLKAVTKAVGDVANQDLNDGPPGRAVAAPGHPLRGNPLFSRLFTKKEKRDTLALTRVLTSHDAAIQLNSPRGLLLHGEVGTGKSMLVDILADSLPNSKKKRWHFNTFMLETLSRLESIRQTQLTKGNVETEYSILVIAKEMIETSPILFLDEFQLPDRAASKILSNLLTTFFQLGGVLIASSNRMPDELDKASGVEFTAPVTGGVVRNLFGFRSPATRGGLTDPGKGEFIGFLEVLKARCEIWDMGGDKDWRRRDTEVQSVQRNLETMREEMIEGFTGLEKMAPGNLILDYEQGIHHNDEAFLNRPDEAKAIAPRNYLILGVDSEESFKAVIRSSLPKDTPTVIPWKSMTLLVYGRIVTITQEYSGTAVLTFDDLCGGAFGPADYITIASTFHTIILDGVPILTLFQKNEARRLITLLDALYEARCKLIIRAQAGPDSLFFPETDIPGEKESGDSVYSETISEIYQDQTSPFRPNVSSYTGNDVTKTGYDPDEDSDFGPVPGAGNEIGRKLDFGNTSSFTGEDERFAYKRARSRLWEMCGVRWHARNDPGWWRPLPLEIRRWEGGEPSKPRHPVTGKIIGEVADTSLPSFLESEITMGEAVELDKLAGLQGKEDDARKSGLIEEGKANPWKKKDYPEPKIGWTPSGMISWAKSKSTDAKSDISGTEKKHDDRS